MIRLSQIFSILLLYLWLSTNALASTVLAIPLERLAQTAENIFYGTAINNEIKLDEASGRVVTLTTFEVINVVKGNVASTHTIKQLGGQLPGSNVIRKIHGIPRFSVGEKYVVFLPAVSVLGFSSPLGLDQGRIAVHENNGLSTVGGSQHTQTSINGVANKQSAISLTDYLQTVRKLVAE